MTERRQTTALQHADEQEWISALETNERWLKQVLRNRLHSEEEVNDVFQEVSLAVSRKDLRPEDISKAGSWLYRVAIRQAMQYRRKSGRYRRLINNNQQLTPRTNQQGEVDPLEALLATERVEAVRQALKALSDVDREILYLKYVENWTYQQLADNLGVSMNTIEHRIVKSKKRLRKHLAQFTEGVKP